MPRLYNEEGWRDNISVFVASAAAGLTEPGFVDMGNGLYAYGFTDGEALVISHHIDHDIKPLGETFFHIHWAPTATIVAGETLSFTIDYVIAKGHHQGQTLADTSTSLTLTYTADGTELVGEHMIIEATSPIVTPEVDSMIISKVTYNDGTYTGGVYGFTMDLHYQVDRNSTPQKSPDFYNYN